MKLLLGALVIAGLACVGCSKTPPDDSTVKPGSGVALNPSGRPAQDQAAYASQMSKTGSAMNSQRDKDAAAMEAAKAKAGSGGQ